MPPNAPRYCPACNRELSPDEKLETIEGLNKPARPGMTPPTTEVRACAPCKKGFLGVLFLLKDKFPAAIIWPENDPRRPAKR
jgi:hypothetical protein